MSRVEDIRVPDIGDFENVPIIEIAVAPGDSVVAEDPLVTLESDKATMDVPSPLAGVVKEMKVNVGDTVSEGSLILTLEINDAPAAEAPPEPAEREPLAPVAASEAPAAEAPPPAPDEAPASPAARPSPTASMPTLAAAAHAPSHATPSVRRFARELGVDLGRVHGTGRKGRILREDVTRFVKGAIAAGGAAVEAGAGIAPIPPVDFAKFGEIELQPLTRIKKISGAHLQRAWLNVPHVTHHEEADVTEMEAFRQSLKEEAARQGVRVTALSFIMKGVCAALREFPSFNASLAGDGENLVMKKYFHIGVAVDTPNGLVVPVIRDVDTKGIMDLGAELAELSARAREGKLKPEEMQGGCMSISSLGGIGGTGFTPIVNAPEVAILGVTRSRMKPVWNGQTFEPRLILPLDLSYDHRVIDGAEAARFMSFLAGVLGDVRRLLL
ncbi:MAG: dihydrolipoyllysine-residue acetyltransferase [Gammaproteobacteria bacterium]|nr:dihydrolipoyllysine-residue acetyltransferase [Gammaproteobacteria bacterium]NIM74958.1 dihydrolipoyllysine-residue acetyltransferase [Gammaproteobacteria bacterium]NIN39747.1 dihydrolipoyllysine-residue acetyltransferase [Gammaproteobacteria bacterium]NIO26875.1 dihydrolipoyllysine-residue acetyltransferase [Gammaproteobacteria bacterium]NIO67431.1 dihydrolipoyllysine-residue acetyltransferase [Gammaproteobacteria bacterium]